MQISDGEKVLLVCGDAAHTHALLGKLHDAGVGIVGAVSSAAMALAMTAIAAPTLAVVAGRPTGQRDEMQLAQALMKDWGVRTLILEQALDGALKPSGPSSAG